MRGGNQAARDLSAEGILAPPPPPAVRLRPVPTPVGPVPASETRGGHSAAEASRSLRAAAGPTVGMLSHLTLASMAVFSVAVVAPTAAVEIGVAPTAIGIYVSGVYGFGVISGLFTGALATRFGAMRTCQTAMLLVAIAMVLLTIATPAAAAASAMVLGLAYGMLNPASARILSSVADQRLRPLMFSIKQSGVPLGGVLAGVAIPALILGLGWKAAVFVVACLALAVAAGCQSMRSGFDASRDRNARLAAKSLIEPVRLVWRCPDLRVLSVISVAYAGCQICLGSFFVIYLIAEPNLTLLDAGIAFTALQLGGFLGRLGWGAVAGRFWSAWGVLVLLGAMMVANLVLLITVADSGPLWLYVAAGFALGATCYGWNGVFFSEIARRAPDDRCEDATGAVQSLMFAGVVVFPPLFAAAVAITGGYAAGFWVLTAAVAATTALAWKKKLNPNV